MRWSGGFGAALDTPRPIFLGAFGMDFLVPVGGSHSVGVALDVFWREYPEASSSPERPEGSAGLYYRWRRSRPRGRWSPWVGVGAGYRQRRLRQSGDDPLLGSMRHHGVSLAFEGGGDVRLSDDTRLALFFNWTLGCYLGATRDDSSAFVEAYDETPPPPRPVSCIDTSSSTYSGGLRWSMQFD